MKGVLFFIFLCLTLVANYDHASASVGHGKVRLTSQARLTNTCQNHSFLTHTSPDNSAIVLLCEDIEEDDDINNSTARKYRLLNGYAWALPFLIDSVHHSGYIPDTFTSHLTGIYILQRSLRI